MFAVDVVENLVEKLTENDKEEIPLWSFFASVGAKSLGSNHKSI
jgi:hypothetical protein